MYDETGYHPPDWSAVPKEAFNLEVLKDGLIIDTIYLADKVYYTLGRQHDIVDIPMDHPSISRVHAVLNCQYKDIPVRSVTVGRPEDPPP